MEKYLSRRVGQANSLSIETYLADGGYASVKRVLGGAMTSLIGRSEKATANALISDEVDGTTKVALSWQPDGIPVRHAPGQQPPTTPAK